MRAPVLRPTRQHVSSFVKAAVYASSIWILIRASSHCLQVRCAAVMGRARHESDAAVMGHAGREGDAAVLGHTRV